MKGIYKCRECGSYFDHPLRRVERHGFDNGPMEEWTECPICESSDFGDSFIVETEEAAGE